MNHRAAFGVYREEGEVKRAIRILYSRGFNRDSIAVLLPKHDGSKDFSQWLSCSIKEGAYIGAIVGGIIFLIIDWFIIAGILFGSMCGVLVGIGTPQAVSERYNTYLNVGGILISVHVNNDHEVRIAKEILEKTGGQDVHLLNENVSWKTIYGKGFAPLK